MIDPKKIEEWKRIDDRWQAVADYESVPKDSPSAVGRYEAFIHAANEALPALLAEREEMIALLRDIEWSGEEYLDYDLSHSACPTCRGIDPSEIEDDHDRGKASDANLRIGHAPDCRLAAFLKGSTPAPER